MKSPHSLLRVSLAACCALVLCLGQNGARADDDPPPNDPRPTTPPATPDAPAAGETPSGSKVAPEKRDPFAPSERLRTGPGAGGDKFVASEHPDLVPGLRLRGYAEDADGNTVALLEVGGGGQAYAPRRRDRDGTVYPPASAPGGGSAVYLVRNGDTVSLPQRGRNLVIRVTEVGNLSLKVEIGELRREVIVR